MHLSFSFFLFAYFCLVYVCLPIIFVSPAAVGSVQGRITFSKSFLGSGPRPPHVDTLSPVILVHTQVQFAELSPAQTNHIKGENMPEASTLRFDLIQKCFQDICSLSILHIVDVKFKRYHCPNPFPETVTHTCFSYCKVYFCYLNSEMHKFPLSMSCVKIHFYNVDKPYFTICSSRPDKIVLFGLWIMDYYCGSWIHPKTNVTTLSIIYN